MKRLRLLIFLMAVLCNAADLQLAFAQDKNELRAEEADRSMVITSIESIQSAPDSKPALAEVATSPPITGPTYRDPITGMEFVYIKGGCFLMGDVTGTGRNNEQPVHEVCVEDFYLGKYEVTQGQWKTVMGYNPSNGKIGNEYPVNEVSWTAASQFATQLKSKTGLNYRLPTEAEWEYAARSGGRNDRWPGTNKESELKDYAWYSGFEDRDIHPVGLKKPNDLGLHDMSGNVKEWVSDWYEDTYFKNSPKYDTGGPHSDIIQSWSRRYKRKVHRGGCTNDKTSQVRTAYRDKDDLDRRHKEIGFRLAIQIIPEQTTTISYRFQPPVLQGDRVDIRYAETRDEFRVMEIRPDGLMVKTEHMDSTPQFIRYVDIDSFKVSIPRTPGQGAANGIGKGAAFGASAGAITELGNALFMISHAASGAGAGMLIGATIGAAYPGRRWEDVRHVERFVDKQTGAPDISQGLQAAADRPLNAAREIRATAGDLAGSAPKSKLQFGSFIPYTEISHSRGGSPDYLYINNLESGVGFGFRLRYELASHFAIEWSSAATLHSIKKAATDEDSIQDQMLSSTELGIRYAASAFGSLVEPYIQAGLGYHCLGDLDSLADCHYRGFGRQIGIGIAYPIWERLSLSAGLTDRRIVFSDGTWIGSRNVQVNAVTFDIGLTTHY